MNDSIEIYKIRINRVLDFVGAHLDKSFSLEELAAVSHFSPYHFHRIFVAVTGETVNKFTIRSRLEKAAKLLKFSKNNISTIAYECGFSSSAVFSRSFKKHFELSPRAYRTIGNLKNSKIGKELFAVTDYHCPVEEKSFRNNFPVEIKEFPKRRIAYIRVLDSFREGVVLAAFEQIIRWAKKMNIFDMQTIFGMSEDDPTVTPKEKYTYEVCITIPEELEISEENYMETMILPKCHYAVTSISGDFNKVATAINFLFNTWLINSPYEPKHLPGLEIYKDNNKVLDWSHFDLDLCIPIKKLKGFQAQKQK